MLFTCSSFVPHIFSFIFQFLEHSKTTHALGRVGTIDEVGKAILFLASDDSSFITGCNLPVDGGMQAMCSN